MNRPTHILIIEDEPAIAGSLQDGLARDGYSVTWKNNGAGDLTIDLSRGQVLQGQRVIGLTPTEFRLLVYLAQHPQQALTRAQMLDAVWGYSANVEDERTVNVHIRRLREKVEPDPSHPTMILTVPGIGYRLAQ